MKTLLTIYTLVFTVMFSTPVFSEEAYICSHWVRKDDTSRYFSEGKDAFGLKINKNDASIILDKNEAKLIQRSRHGNDLYYLGQIFDEVISVQRITDKKVELHKFQIQAPHEQHYDDDKKKLGVRYYSTIWYSTCRGF